MCTAGWCRCPRIRPRSPPTRARQEPIAKSHLAREDHRALRRMQALPSPIPFVALRLWNPRCREAESNRGLCVARRRVSSNGCDSTNAHASGTEDLRNHVPGNSGIGLPALAYRHGQESRTDKGRNTQAGELNSCPLDPGGERVTPLFLPPISRARMQFCEGILPFGLDRMQFGEGELPFGLDRMQFGEGELPFGLDRMQFGEGEIAFGLHRIEGFRERRASTLTRPPVKQSGWPPRPWAHPPRADSPKPTLLLHPSTQPGVVSAHPRRLSVAACRVSSPVRMVSVRGLQVSGARRGLSGGPCQVHPGGAWCRAGHVTPQRGSAGLRRAVWCWRARGCRLRLRPVTRPSAVEGCRAGADGGRRSSPVAARGCWLAMRGRRPSKQRADPSGMRRILSRLSRDHANGRGRVSARGIRVHLRLARDSSPGRVQHGLGRRDATLHRHPSGSR